MSSGDSETGRLIGATRACLAPAPFPPRRDLEFISLSADGGGGDLIFYDVFWTRPWQLSCFLARLRGEPGPATAAAHVLKPLLRTALRRHDAARALAASVEALGSLGLATPILDIAAATMRTDNGDATFGTAGAEACVRLGNDAARDRSRTAHGHTRLAAGEHIRLSVGDIVAAWTPTVVAPSSILDRARAALAGSASAAVAIVTLRALREGRGRTLTLANDVVEISPTIAELMDYLQARGVGDDDLPGLELALDELLTNIVLYAYGDGGAHEIVVHVDVRDDGVDIEIKDDGTAFDPTVAAAIDTAAELEDRPIGGLGLHLARTVFNTFSYRRVRGWNLLSLTKHRRVAAVTAAAGPEFERKH